MNRATQASQRPVAQTARSSIHACCAFESSCLPSPHVPRPCLLSTLTSCLSSISLHSYEARDLDLDQSVRDGLSQIRGDLSEAKKRISESEKRIDADLAGLVAKAYWCVEHGAGLVPCSNWPLAEHRAMWELVALVS